MLGDHEIPQHVNFQDRSYISTENWRQKEFATGILLTESYKDISFNFSKVRKTKVKGKKLNTPREERKNICVRLLQEMIPQHPNLVETSGDVFLCCSLRFFFTIPVKQILCSCRIIMSVTDIAEDLGKTEKKWEKI